MFEYASVFVNILLTHVSAVCIKLYPQRKHIRMGIWQVALVFLGIAALQLAGYLFIRSIVEYSYPLIQSYKIFSMVITAVVPFFLVPRRFFQNLFLWGVTLNLGTMVFGMANYIEVMHGNEFARNYPYLISNGVTVLLQIICLPILASYLKKMFAMWDGMERAAIWKIIWLLPVLFFAFTVAAQNIISGVTLSFSFVIIRFLVGCGVIIVCYVLAKALREEAEKAGLAENARMTQNQLALQREQYDTMAENAEATKARQHDFRHQLAVIKGYNNAGDMDGLGAYLDELTANIPPTNEQALCENFAVNAVALHYISLAEGEGIDTSLQLSIPAKTGRVLDSDLCVIVGNLLENAIDACKRVPEGERFIKLNTLAQYDTLTVTMDNSFDGNAKEKDGMFYSTKRDGEGVGLSSIRAVARKYGGSARFEVNENVFMSSVFIDMRAPETAAE